MNLQIIYDCAGTDPGLPAARTDLDRRDKPICFSYGFNLSAFIKFSNSTRINIKTSTLCKNSLDKYCLYI